MAHPLGFSIRLTDGTPRSCDVCTQAINGPRVETYVGNAWQSALCLDCVADAAVIVRPDPMAKARAAKAAKLLALKAQLRESVAV